MLIQLRGDTERISCGERSHTCVHASPSEHVCTDAQTQARSLSGPDQLSHSPHLHPNQQEKEEINHLNRAEWAQVVYVTRTPAPNWTESKPAPVLTIGAYNIKKNDKKTHLHRLSHRAHKSKANTVYARESHPVLRHYSCKWPNLLISRWYHQMQTSSSHLLTAGVHATLLSMCKCACVHVKHGDCAQCQQLISGKVA